MYIHNQLKLLHDDQILEINKIFQDCWQTRFPFQLQIRRCMWSPSHVLRVERKNSCERKHKARKYSPKDFLLIRPGSSPRHFHSQALLARSRESREDSHLQRSSCCNSVQPDSTGMHPVAGERTRENPWDTQSDWKSPFDLWELIFQGLSRDILDNQQLRSVPVPHGWPLASRTGTPPRDPGLLSPRLCWKL